MGFLLFLFVMGLFHDRLVPHPLPPSPLAPSLWIGLGPVGVAVLAPITLARVGQDITGPAGPTDTAISQLFGTAMWGFGLWWLAIAVALLVRYRRAGALPFNLGWWAGVDRFVAGTGHRAGVVVGLPCWRWCTWRGACSSAPRLRQKSRLDPGSASRWRWLCRSPFSRGCYVSTTDVDLRMATVLVVVGAAGSFLGACLTSRFVSGPVLKQVFGILIVVMTAVKVVAIVTS